MALMPVAEALERILKTARPTGAETVKLTLALGRVSASEIKAKHNQPPFAASAMDGYAVKYDDVSALPANLTLVGTSAAGHGFLRTVKRGQAVRIFTGAPVPKGADTVVIQENTFAKGKMVTITGTTGLGRNIRAIGLDFSKGSVLVPKNTTLAARDIGLAAAGDHPTLRVRVKPRVAILSTGDELALPGQKRRVDQIVSSNSFALSAFATSCGAEVHDLGIIRDNLAATTAAILRASSADILVTTGGASVGGHDFVQQALRDAGVKIDFWKIAMRPGKPFMFGTKGHLRVLGLPGNPVAALVCAQLFLRPLIAKMLGLAPISAPTHARAGAVLAANDQRQDYLRARLTHAADGGLVATPFSLQDSSMQRTMREANCLIVRAPFAGVAEIGSLLDILLLSDGA